MANKDNKVVKYNRPFHVSIGFVIIGVMLFYLVYHVYTYITTEKINIYEVTIGTISSNREYNALALRSEEIINAPKSGTIVYLAPNVGKVGIKSDVFAIDETDSVIKDMKLSSLSDESIDEIELGRIQSQINSFILDYKGVNYNRTYSFKTDLASGIDQLYNLSAMEALSSQIESAKNRGTFHVYKAPKPGVCVYNIDGFEGITAENFGSDNFDTSKVTLSNLKSKTSINEGQPIYKLITSDVWYLVMEIDNKLAADLAEDKYLKIQFLDDNVKTWASISIETRNNTNYLVCKLDDSLERYATDRFIHIKLLDSNSTGLKIPNSAITTKEFFCIPKEYFSISGDGSTYSLARKVDGGVETIVPTIYYETDDYYYLDHKDINVGDVLVKLNSNSLYVVGSNVASLEGVYNVNKGFAVFKQIKKIYQNADYTIVESMTKYGISLYDHIALQGDKVSEDQML